ncbi:hypothetical protein DO97_03120 [Neosynechococcus sphagnicola sy1]|uniref:Probable nicotinate-nucleotide adenylyltransferase n=1 Tax=Neosynechococcus sphagnicola sy1 TaxID=1497020 RepID=A0A098TMF1_9CYAN|nr:nicotinate (nicotinamide) nucleotide adenylyltransferase [Neosynechococcus sphagnicola]KGF73037.1 hypothetical protein DO97_03120 [Neosynechococcus sphagnicola sy1]
MPRIAIFGGTFDPVHWGHLLIAETALNQCALDQVIWVPTHLPPHKLSQPQSGFEHRAAMVAIAIADQPRFRLSTLEARRAEPSYAISTLRDLAVQYPHAEWFWVIGLDAFETLPRWQQCQTVAATCEWLVAPRGCCDLVHSPPLPKQSPMQQCQQITQQLAARGVGLRWQLLQIPTLDISSSLIRQYQRDRRSIRYLLPESVQLYIKKHQLYLHAADLEI